MRLTPTTPGLWHWIANFPCRPYATTRHHVAFGRQQLHSRIVDRPPSLDHVVAERALSRPPALSTGRCTHRRSRRRRRGPMTGCCCCCAADTNSIPYTAARLVAVSSTINPTTPRSQIVDAQPSAILCLADQSVGWQECVAVRFRPRRFSVLGCCTWNSFVSVSVCRVALPSPV